MKKFKIIDTQKYLSETYEVEAENKEDALDKYVNELVGSLPIIDSNYDPDSEDGIEVMDI